MGPDDLVAVSVSPLFVAGRCGTMTWLWDSVLVVVLVGPQCFDVVVRSEFSAPYTLQRF